MELRAYYFGNMYLSSIQQGIQAAHATADMFVRYQPFITDEECDQPCDQYSMLTDWAANHKTMILLNAGYSAEIHDLVQFFDNVENPYPWSSFYESHDALDNAITTVGIVLPEYIWVGARQLREGPMRQRDEIREQMVSSGTVTWIDPADQCTVSYDINRWEFQLIERLNNYGLAK